MTAWRRNSKCYTILFLPRSGDGGKKGLVDLISTFCRSRVCELGDRTNKAARETFLGCGGRSKKTKIGRSCCVVAAAEIPALSRVVVVVVANSLLRTACHCRSKHAQTAPTSPGLHNGWLS